MSLQSNDNLEQFDFIQITKKEVNELSILFRSIKMPISLFTALILLFGTLAASFGSVLPIAYADSSAVALIEGFETVTNMSPAFAKANSVKLDLLSRPDPVLYGYHAAKLIHRSIEERLLPIPSPGADDALA